VTFKGRLATLTRDCVFLPINVRSCAVFADSCGTFA